MKNESEPAGNVPVPNAGATPEGIGYLPEGEPLHLFMNLRGRLPRKIKQGEIYGN
jgi:hypothetical protein